MIGKAQTPSVKDRMAFLEAVACGRGTKSQRFRDWFPELSGKNLESLPKYARWRMNSTVWKNPNVRPATQVTDDGGIFEEMLRHQLRVAWHRAVADDSPKASVARLRSEVREFQHLIRRARGGTEPGPDIAVWCQRIESALAWLERNTHKLKLCAIADCKSPYFIISAFRKKYCSDYCQDVAEVERSKERVRRIAEEKRAEAQGVQGLKKSRLTPEGRERIVRAVKRRWEARRKEKRSPKSH
jgi:hypothetical protein